MDLPIPDGCAHAFRCVALLPPAEGDTWPPSGTASPASDDDDSGLSADVPVWWTRYHADFCHGVVFKANVAWRRLIRARLHWQRMNARWQRRKDLQHGLRR